MLSKVRRRRRIHKLSRFVRWPLAEQRLFLLALWLLPLTTLGMRLFGFKRWYALLARFPARAGWSIPGKDDDATARYLSRSMRMADRHLLLHNSCLAQSLTLWWLLRCHGLHSDLRIGIRLEHGQLEAHAWIEYDGRPLGTNQHVREEFVTFDRVITPQSGSSEYVIQAPPESGKELRQSTW
jgi:hypothetical protein